MKCHNCPLLLALVSVRLQALDPTINVKELLARPRPEHSSQVGGSVERSPNNIKLAVPEDKQSEAMLST